jgi:hypothetical protein
LEPKVNRKLCGACQTNPAAINYTDKRGVTHYRSMCITCVQKGRRIKPQPPLWFKNGYRKKSACEKCNFKAKYPEEQLRVFHLDGNLRNTSWNNLRTICLNCQQEIFKSRLAWKPADLVPDF